MRNAILIGILALIVGAVGIYFALTGTKNLGATVNETIEKMATNIQLLSQKVPPFIAMGDPVSYVIEFENGAKFYFGGDTGIMADMKLVVNDYYEPDVAFLPISNFYTMDPKGAAYAASLIDPAKYVIPNHYKSFPLLTQDPQSFFNELTKYNLRAQPLKFEVGVEQTVMGVKVVWLGHGDWYFTTPQGTKILIDPEVEYNVAYPEAYKDLTKFGKVDLILITHAHFDHMTIPDLKKWLKLYDPIMIVPFEAGVWLKDVLGYTNIMPINKGANIGKTEMLKMGMPETNVQKLADVRIHMVSASHSSSATPEGLSPRY